MAYVREGMELIRIKLFGALVVIAIVVVIFSWKCAADVLEMRSMVLDIKICRHSVASEVGSSHRLKIIAVHIEARQVIKVNKFKHWYTPRRRDILVLLGEVNVVSIKGCVSEFNDLVPALMCALKERAGVFAAGWRARERTRKWGFYRTYYSTIPTVFPHQGQDWATI